jgi:hypothetical protein
VDPITYLVQFVGPVREAWKAAVEETGARLYGYIPDYAFITWMDATTAEEVEALPFVRWVGPYHPAYRLDPSLYDPRSITRRPVAVTVQTLPDVDLDALMDQVSAWGGEIQRYGRNNGASYVRVTMAANRLDDLAAVEGVLWVEPYFEPELANDIGGGMIMRANAVRANLGLYGSGQIVAVADSGLDTGNLDTIHPDVKGRIIKTYALGRTDDWSDPNGHGTHVAGSVLGDGHVSGGISATHQYDNAYAGTAPEASLVFQALGDDQGGLRGIPADTGALMRTAHADGARIHTNSWGGPTGGTQQAPEYGGYTASSQQVDQAMWEHKDMLTLFCAHNHGVDVDKDGVVDPDTVTEPGTAKNVLTVGASENDRDEIASTWGNTYAEPIASDKKADNPSGMASFSSRGPLDDGRVKPDIVAPGTYIASLRTRQYVFDDDMEAASTADDYAQLTFNGGTGDTWQLAVDDPHSPTHYWKATVNGTYNSGAMTLLLAPVANVKPVGGAFDLIFWHKYNLGGDNQLVLLVTDNDLSPQFWIPLDRSGSRTSYELFSMTIPTTLCDQQTQTCIDFSNFGVGFAIISQSGSYNSEWWLDDIRGDGADWGAMSSVGLAQPGDAVDEAYVMQGGTSMATPLTAGAAALVREWYNDRGIANPSGALLKATLLNGAADMAPGQYGTGSAQEIPAQRPNNVTGWGRVDLVESLDPPAPRTIWFTDTLSGLNTGGVAVYTLTLGALPVHANEGFNFPQRFVSSPAYVSAISELLQNRSFEDATGGVLDIWQDNDPYEFYIGQTSMDAHSGTYSAFMGGYYGADLLLYQSVNFPGDATAGALQVYVEGLGLSVDVIQAELWIETGAVDTLVATHSLNAVNDTWTENTWNLDSGVLDQLKGQQIYVIFRATMDSMTSYYLVDDASLSVTTGSGVSATLAITPTSGPRGTTFTATGSDFNASDTVTITIDGIDQLNVASDASGAFSFDLTPPGTIAKGSHVITATDTGGRSAGDTFEIVPQVSVTISPSVGLAGDAFAFTGAGFHGGSTITVTLDGAVDGITTAHTSGAFTYTLTTDVGIPAGAHLVNAIDGEASTAGDTVTITASTARRVSISPSTGLTGTTFTISGTNFTADAVVTLTVDTAFIMTTTADAGGAFSAPYTPTNLSVGQHILRADDGDGQAQTTFTITAPPARHVGITPARGPNGTTFSITGTNFTVSAVVTLTVDGAFIMTTTADAGGAFSTPYTPIGLDAGEYTLVADDGDGRAQTTFTITVPSQTGGPFRITLVWTDYPGELSAAKALVNDLDLEIIAPDGTHYYGNQGLYTSGQCLREGKWDACNNVEGVVISDALHGTYTVMVHGYNIPQGSQPFALVASGDNVRAGTVGPPLPDRQLTVSPQQGTNGTPFTIMGANFMASAGVTLTVDGAFIKTATTDGGGMFTATYTSTSLSAGQHTLVANDGSGQAQVTFTITVPSARQVSITPTEGLNGTPFTVVGSNFTASAVVTLTVAGDFVKTVTANISGTFTTPYTPTSLSAGQHTLVANDGSGQAQATFTITVSSARQVSITPTQGPNGTPLTIAGVNFTASAGVTLTVDSGFIKTVTANISGTFTTTYTPTSLSAGQHTLIADDGDGQAQTTFRIEAYPIYLPLVLRM